MAGKTAYIEVIFHFSYHFTTVGFLDNLAKPYCCRFSGEAVDLGYFIWKRPYSYCRQKQNMRSN
jgi:hypothetical protein